MKKEYKGRLLNAEITFQNTDSCHGTRNPYLEKWKFKEVKITIEEI